MIQKNLVKELILYLSIAGVAVLAVAAFNYLSDDIDHKFGIVYTGDYSKFGVSEKEPVVVIVKTGCSACIQLKQKLSDNNISFTEYEITDHQDKIELLSGMDINTVPVTILRDRLIIGYSDRVIETEVTRFKNYGS